MNCFVVVYWEGGTIEQVDFKTWWSFIFADPQKMRLPAPPGHRAVYQAKCFAGVCIGNRSYGYDFVIGRKWRQWEANRQHSLTLPDCPDGIEFNPQIHNSYSRKSKPFTCWMAWRTSGVPHI